MSIDYGKVGTNSEMHAMASVDMVRLLLMVTFIVREEGKVDFWLTK